MIKFAWSGPADTRSWGEVLDDLETAGAKIADFKFFTWMHGKDEYRVVAYVEGEGRFPDDFDEATARETFFKDIFRVHRVGV
jgi:hypothetical protein